MCWFLMRWEIVEEPEEGGDARRCRRSVLQDIAHIAKEVEEINLKTWLSKTSYDIHSNEGVDVVNMGCILSEEEYNP